MNNFERIKNMTLDEMAEVLTQLLCKDCGYVDNWALCQQIDCWCHANNEYKQMKQWLQAESEG